MKITQAPVLSLEDDRVRRQLLDALERVEPALGTSVSALPDPKVVGAHMHRNMTGLVIGLAGAIAALGGVQLAGQAMDEKMALMALLIGIAFAGLALVGLFGLVGIWLENFAAQRLTLLQSRLDAAEDNELAVTGFEAFSALTAIRTWRTPLAQTELTDEVVTFVADRYAHASIETLRMRYGRIAELARQAAPSEQSAEDVLRHLRPESVNWPTDLSGAVRMADASGTWRSGGAYSTPRMKT